MLYIVRRMLKEIESMPSGTRFTVNDLKRRLGVLGLPWLATRQLKQRSKRPDSPFYIVDTEGWNNPVYQKK